VFGVGTGIFFVSYFLLEVPCNLLLEGRAQICRIVRD
jgi:hypothetical protein